MKSKQQINALCLRHGHIYEGNSRWTPKHLAWLRSLKLDNPVLQETLAESTRSKANIAKTAVARELA